MEKQKVLYSAFAAQLEPKNREGTVAWIIERFIAEMNGTAGKPPVKSLGNSHLIILRFMQRQPIALRPAAELTKADVISHCRQRQASGVKPQTVMQDVTHLSGALKYAGSAWDDCEEVSDAAILAAKPFLSKHQLISKSTPRDRRPTPEEHAALLAHFAIENARKLGCTTHAEIAEQGWSRTKATARKKQSWLRGTRQPRSSRERISA